MKYKKEKGLKEVYTYIDEADMAIKDKTRTLDDSDFASAIAKGAATSGVLARSVATESAVDMLTLIVLIGITSSIL